MREDWEIKSLSEVCGFQNGFAFKSKTFKDTGTPVVRITNIQDEIIDLKKVVYIDRNDYNKDLSKYEIVNGDLLIAMSGATTGKIGFHLSDEVLLLNQRVGKFEPRKSLNKKYLFYYLSTKVEENLAISAGAAQPNLSTEQIKGFEIPIPPLPEQQQIVALLDQVFEAIDQAKANIEKNIENAKELFQSKLNNIFSQKGEGWEEKILDDICLKITQGPNPKLKVDIPSANNYVLKTKDFYNDRVLYDNCLKVSESLIEEWSRFILRDDDIIIGLVGVGSIGKSNLFKVQDGRKYIFTRATGLIRTIKEKLIPNYLRFYLLSGLGIESINKGIGGTTGQLVIKTSYFKNLSIIIPKDLNEQKEIISQAEIIQSQTDEITKIYTSKLKNLEELKKSMLQKAFAGELTNKQLIEV